MMTSRPGAEAAEQDKIPIYFEDVFSHIYTETEFIKFQDTTV